MFVGGARAPPSLPALDPRLPAIAPHGGSEHQRLAVCIARAAMDMPLTTPQVYDYEHLPSLMYLSSGAPKC